MTKEELIKYRAICVNVEPTPGVLKSIMLVILNHLISEAEKPVERWRANMGENYWFVVDGEVWSTLENSNTIDGRRFTIGNYYRTKDEAKAAAERVRKAYNAE